MIYDSRPELVAFPDTQALFRLYDSFAMGTTLSEWLSRAHFILMVVPVKYVCYQLVIHAWNTI